MRPTRTLALPGDADAVVASEISRALQRDGRCNVGERRALFLSWWCAEARSKYPKWRCSYWKPCCYCAEIDRIG